MPFTPLTVDLDVPSAPAMASAVPPSLPLPKAMNCVWVWPLCFLGSEPCTSVWRLRLEGVLAAPGWGSSGTGVFLTVASSQVCIPEQKAVASGPACCRSSSSARDFCDTYRVRKLSFFWLPLIFSR